MTERERIALALCRSHDNDERDERAMAEYLEDADTVLAALNRETDG